jgi:cyclase
MQCGVEKISINSIFLSNPEFPFEISSILGSSSTVLSLDVLSKNGEYVAVNKSEVRILDAVRDAEKLGFGEILIQDFERDGQLQGPNLDLVSAVSSQTNLPIVYAGGVSNLMESKAVWKAGASGVGAGAWFVYKGKQRAVLINYPNYVELQETYSSIISS